MIVMRADSGNCLGLMLKWCDGHDVKYIVGDSQKLYDRRYCARGEIKNRIQEQMMLFGGRVSTYRWWDNQWRILLSALAYILLVGLRRLALLGTALARATCATFRLKLVR